MATRRETVLDRKVHICDDLREVPDVTPLCEQTPGLTTRRISADEGVLHCEIEGAGTPLVLLSGGPGCSHHYFHPSFSRAASFAQVIYYDQRGTGQSEPDPRAERYALRQAVADLDRLRTELGFARWVVLGHSYGGLLAQCYALEHPERVLGLVLVCAAFALPRAKPAPTRQYNFISPEERTRIEAIQREPGVPTEQRIFNAHLNGDWKRQNYYRPSEEQLARTVRYEWTPAPGFQNQIGQDWEHIDLAGEFDDFAPPTLLMEARWDLTWNTDKPQVLQQHHPRAQLVILEESGHSPFDDEPDEFFSVLSGFVSEAEHRPPLSRPLAPKIVWPSADVERP